MAAAGIDGVWTARPRTGAAVALGALATLLGIAALLLLAPPSGERLLGARAGLVGPLRQAIPLALLALWLVILVRHEARRLAAALALGAGCFVVYAQLTLPAEDNRLGNERCVPAALALLRHGELEPPTPRASAGGAQVRPLRGDPAAKAAGPRTPASGRCSPGVAVAIAPLVWLADGVLDRTLPPQRRQQRIADAVADALAALAVALLFVAARRLGAEPRLALCGALVLGFCTPHLSLHAGGLWSHNVSATLLLAALVLALPGSGEPMAATSAWSGAVAGLAVAARPSALLLAVLPLVVVASRRRTAALAWLPPFAVVLGLVVLWARATSGTLLPPDPDLRLELASFAAWARAVHGLLLSANRGLLVFSPLFLFSLAGAALGIAASDGWKRRFYVTASLCCLALVALVAATHEWWDAFGFGPRRLAELFPLLALLLLPAVQWLLGTPSWSRLVGSGLLVMALVASALVAWRGATAPGTREWNLHPPASESRVRDWSDLQALRQDGRPRGF